VAFLLDFGFGFGRLDPPDQAGRSSLQGVEKSACRLLLNLTGEQQAQDSSLDICL
jgi:hypothetical protein